MWHRFFMTYRAISVSPAAAQEYTRSVRIFKHSVMECCRAKSSWMGTVCDKLVRPDTCRNKDSLDCNVPGAKGRRCDLSRFFIRQSNTCIELHPLVPFDASRLYYSGLHIARAGWKVKVSPSFFFSTFFLLLLPHYQPSSLGEVRSFDVRDCPFWNRN